MYARTFMRWFTTVAAIGLISLLGWRMSVAATPDEMVELAKAGTKNAPSLIVSGKGKITQSSTTRKPDGGIMETEAVADMAFRGDKLRIAELVTYLRNDLPAGATEEDAKHLYPPGKKISQAVSFDGEKLMFFQALTRLAVVDSLESKARLPRAYYQRKKLDYGLLDNHGLWDINAGRPSFPQVDRGLRFVGNEMVDGRDCIVIECTVLTMSKEGDPLPIRSTIIEWSIDTERGFTIPRVRVWVGDSDGEKTTLAEERNNEVRDYGNGVWGPSKSTVVRYAIDKKGERYEHSRIITVYAPDFILNGNVTDSDLTIKLPSKTLVSNEITGESYIVP